MDVRILFCHVETVVIMCSVSNVICVCHARKWPWEHMDGLPGRLSITNGDGGACGISSQPADRKIKGVLVHEDMVRE